MYFRYQGVKPLLAFCRIVREVYLDYATKIDIIIRSCESVKVLVAQSCLTLCDPMDPLGCSVHGILQARTLEWFAIPFSRGSSWPRVHACLLSRFSLIQLCVTLRTVAPQAPLSIAFCRQEYWSGFPCPPPGDLPDPWIKPMSVMSPALAGGFFTTSVTWEALTQSESESLSRVQLSATPWTIAYQVPPPMGFSRQEYWSGLPFPSPGDLPNPGIEPGSPAL